MGSALWPLSGGIGTITSPFGSRVAPIAGASTFHKGIDIAAPSGTGVVSNGGTVISAGNYGNAGNQVQIMGDDGVTSIYDHLSQISVAPGQSIAPGALIGQVGSTGLSTGSHLHYETKSGGSAFNPMDYLSSGKSGLSSAASSLKSALPGLENAGVSAAENAIAPGSSAALNALGLNPGSGGQSLISQLRDWLATTGFFERMALAFFGFILLFGALYMTKTGKTVVNTAAKSVAA